MYLTSKYAGVKWGNDVQLTNNASSSNVSSIAVSGTYLHTIFRDTRNGNTEICYKQYKGSVYASPFGESQIDPELPKSYSLSQNYPNPFNPVTKISFDVPKQSFVMLKIYDLMGREVKTLVNEMKSPGYYSIDFNGTEISSGVYFYRLQSGEFTDIKRMTLLK